MRPVLPSSSPREPFDPFLPDIPEARSVLPNQPHITDRAARFANPGRDDAKSGPRIMDRCRPCASPVGAAPRLGPMSLRCEYMVNEAGECDKKRPGPARDALEPGL